MISDVIPDNRPQQLEEATFGLLVVLNANATPSEVKKQFDRVFEIMVPPSVIPPSHYDSLVNPILSHFLHVLLI